MKTMSIIILLLLCSSGVWAGSFDDGFVVADDITYFGSDIKIGSFKIVIQTEDGEIRKMPTREVKAFRTNGRQFEFLPVTNTKGDTADMAFMEFITMRDGNRLYCYCSDNCKYDPLNGEIAPPIRVYRYYVLKNDKLNLLSDDKEVDQAMAYFNVRIVS
jgi:hypothetical protein